MASIGHDGMTKIHRVHNWAVADATALAALSPVAADIGKLALQADINRLFLLINNTGPVWMMLPATRRVALGTTSGTIDLDLADGDTFTVTINGNATFTFSNPAQAGYTSTIRLIITTSGAGHTRTWPGGVDWPGGTEPTATTADASVDVYTFFTEDGGTTWYGFLPGADMG